LAGQYLEGLTGLTDFLENRSNGEARAGTISATIDGAQIEIVYGRP
jgi:hypothetical protein